MLLSCFLQLWSRCVNHLTVYTLERGHSSTVIQSGPPNPAFKTIWVSLFRPRDPEVLVSQLARYWDTARGRTDGMQYVSFIETLKMKVMVLSLINDLRHKTLNFFQMFRLWANVNVNWSITAVLLNFTESQSGDAVTLHLSMYYINNLIKDRKT